MKILVTGASGFIGSFIVEEALKRGFETWAAIRRSSSREWLQDKRIRFIELNLSSKAQLVDQLRGQDFDYVVHAAGVTKCLNKSDFHRINTEGTKNLVDALLEVGMPLKRFVFVSSLSIFGAIKEKQPYEAEYRIRSQQTGSRTLSRILRFAPTLYYIKADGRIRASGEGLLHHGEEHQAAFRLCCGLSASGHHICLCRGCGTSSVPRS